MKWLDDYRMKMVLAGFVAAVVLGGGSAKADFTFGEPTNLGSEINSVAADRGPCISADGLSLFFSSKRAGGYGEHDLYLASRPTTDDEWAAPTNLGPTVNSPAKDSDPAISADGLELYFASRRTGSYFHDFYIHEDIWVTKRATRTDQWGPPENLGPLINSSYVETHPSLSSDALELYFASSKPGHSSTYVCVARRATIAENWGAPVKVYDVSSPPYLWSPDVSADGRVLVFDSSDPSVLWMMARDEVSDDWSPPIRLGPIINSDHGERGATISPDGRSLLFTCDRPGGEGLADLWQSPIMPVVDFNGDGVADKLDMHIMIDRWGEDYSLCDIGPMPWGDGIVDVEDLKVLAQNLFKEVNDPTLVAHWALDETEGIIAGDSAGDNDAYVMGAALWQPDGGQVNGAIQLDGVDDYMIADSALNPADGPFSVFAWIKGGAPGQGIVAQQVIGDWLILDAEGKLMTDIKCEGRSAVGPLLSDSVITDGQWHRVGLVCA